MHAEMAATQPSGHHLDWTLGPGAFLEPQFSLAWSSAVRTSLLLDNILTPMSIFRGEDLLSGINPFALLGILTSYATRRDFVMVKPDACE